MADALALFLGLLGLAIVLSTGSSIGAVVAWSGLWLEFNQLFEVRWVGWKRSDSDKDDFWIV